MSPIENFFDILYTAKMKWYFASRTRHREALIELEKGLKSQGQKVVSEWVHVYDLIPYAENLARTQETAEKVVHAINDADIFVLISDREGTDMFVELGAALAKYDRSPDSIRIYIVGDHNKRSLMQLHRAITHLSSMNEVLEKEGLNSEFQMPEFE